MGYLVVLDPTDFSLCRQKLFKHSSKYLFYRKNKVIQEVMHGTIPSKTCHARFDIKHPSFLTVSSLMSNLLGHVLIVISECIRMTFEDCNFFLQF